MLWEGPALEAEPGATPAPGVESLADEGLDEEEPEILGESAGLLGNCGLSDTMLLTQTHARVTELKCRDMLHFKPVYKTQELLYKAEVQNPGPGI